MNPRPLPILLLLLLSPLARADTLILKDGSTRAGTIEKRDNSAVRLRINADGISAIITVPLNDIARIEMGPAPLPAAPRRTADTAPATATSQPRPATTTQPFPSRGFLGELAASAIGKGPDDPSRLSPEQLTLWNTAVALDAQKKSAETLDALRNLESAFHDQPNGLSRLDGLSKRLRDEPFGTWMGRIHWDLIAQKYRGGQFDLRDLRDPERPYIIGILREKTAPALDPLKSYFPPIDPKTNNPEPFRPSQLQGITLSNALEIKDKALYATAILTAQLRLEPQMPAADKALLSAQLAPVNRILTRATELEPAARQALAKAEQDRKLAEERARRDALRSQQRSSLGIR